MRQYDFFYMRRSVQKQGHPRSCPRDMELDADQFDKILDFLEANNIDVLRITEDDDDIILDEEDEVEVEDIDLTVPDGVSIEDPRTWFW